MHQRLPLLRLGFLLLACLLAAPPAPATSAPEPVTAHHAMVVSAQHLATRVGVSILKQGGNAIDAAVAVGYALAVVHPCCGNLGGGGFMTLHLADGRNLFLNFRETAPLKATADMYLKPDGSVDHRESLYTYKAVGVPGTVMGLDTALQRYGTMKRAAVMAPAIRLAQQGYVLTPGDAAIFAEAGKKLESNAPARKQFLIDGHLPRAGERLKQPELARTLQMISKEGPKAFYDGPIADDIVKASEANGGLLTRKDFSDYRAEWLPVITCTYQGYTIVSAPPPSSGGVTLCEMLNILSGWPGFPHYAFHSVASVHYLVETMRFAYADRNTNLGDPDFVNNPVQRLLSDKHAEWIRKQIPAWHAVPSSEVHGGTVDVTKEGRHTTQYSIVDSEGNAVSVTYTINSLFGTGLVAAGTGFLLNNEMNDFTAKPGVPNQFGLVQGKANAIAGGKRPLSSMTPTIVLDKGGNVFMVTGSPGGSTIINTTMETILNVIDRGMNVKQAVDAPRIHQQWLPDIVYLEPGALKPAVKRKLEKLGYHFETRSHWGAAEAIVVMPDGLLTGGNDRRRPAGLAAGY